MLIVLAFVVICVLLVCFYLFKREVTENPFSITDIKPSKSTELDSVKRDAVIKQAFNISRVPNDLDVIIIGSGIGALSCGAILSKAGKKTLVLEQHDQAGGCCHVFEEKGYEFDVGIHYIGEMERRQSHFKTYVDLITNGQLQWAPLETAYDTVLIGNLAKDPKKFPLTTGSRDKVRDNLIRQFPAEKEGVIKFLAMIQEVRKNELGLMMAKVMPYWFVKLIIKFNLVGRFTKFFELSQRSVLSVVKECTNDVDLQTVLCYCWGDYGTLPDEAPFTMHAILMLHYFYSASYPVGGASEIALHTIPTIERSGGKVMVRAEVKSIILEDGRAVGVQVSKGQSVHNIRAPIIISDAGLINTFVKLLPAEVSMKSRYMKYVTKVGSGEAGFSLFVGLRGSAKELGLKAENFWAISEPDISGSARKYFELPSTDAPDHDVPLLFISFPSAKDPTWNQRYPDKSTCTIVTVVPYKWFEQWSDARIKHRGDDYEALKNAIAHRMWEQTLGYFPSLADKVEYFEAGSPVSNNHYIASPAGEIYGMNHSMNRFKPEVVAGSRPETDIPGLYITGQDVFLCGFAGASYGGLLCASKILNRNLYDDIDKVKHQLRAKVKEA